MRWDSINWKDGLIHLIEQKTRKERTQPIIPALRRVLERLKQQSDAHDEYVFPDMAVYFNTGAGGRVSTMFTDLLRAHGLIKVTFAKKEGRRHTIDPKSFHSLRHSVVSMLRSGVVFFAHPHHHPGPGWRVQKSLDLHGNLHLRHTPTARHLPYLHYHREHVFIP